MCARFISVTAVLSVSLVLCSFAMSGEERPCYGAGRWFPRTKARLTVAIDKYLREKPESKVTGRPLGIIAPHAGYRFCGRSAGAAFAQLKGHQFHRVVVLGISHRQFVKGASILPVKAYTTPLGKIPVDTEVTDKLLKNNLFKTQPRAHYGEHSVENELPFLTRVLGADWKLVPILIGQPSRMEAGISAESLKLYENIAAAIKPFVDDKTLVVASSDWTHYGANYGYFPFGRKAFSGDELKAKLKAFDYETIEPVLNVDVKTFAQRVNAKKVTVCGRRPICVFLNLMSEGVKGFVAKYYTSGDVTNDWSSSVSYTSIVFARPANGDGVSEVGRKRLLEIARKTLEARLRGKPVPKFKADSAELRWKRGVFVTLTKNGKLRGCIGCFTSDEPLYKVVSDYAVISATRDRRFRPVRASELKNIKIEISVLSPMRRVKDPLKEVVIGKHGIYIKRGYRSGTYLPQVAVEHKMSLEQFLSSCCSSKAGLRADAWKDPRTEVYVYTAQGFHED